jgi:hypothetical protein
MRYVQQKQHNDCLSACLAAVLDIPLAAVPVFPPEKFKGDRQIAAVNKWLANMHLALVEVPVDMKARRWPWCGEPKTVVIGTVQTGTGTHHSVVAIIQRGELTVAYDPAPPGYRVDKYKFTHVGFIVPTVSGSEEWEDLRLLRE